MAWYAHDITAEFEHVTAVLTDTGLAERWTEALPVRPATGPQETLPTPPMPVPETVRQLVPPTPVFCAKKPNASELGVVIEIGVVVALLGVLVAVPKGLLVVPPIGNAASASMTVQMIKPMLLFVFGVTVIVSGAETVVLVRNAQSLRGGSAVN